MKKAKEMDSYTILKSSNGIPSSATTRLQDTMFNNTTDYNDSNDIPTLKRKYIFLHVL